MVDGSRYAVRTRLAVLLLALVVLGASSTVEAGVLLIVVDGLDARELTEDAMPSLARAWRESRWCPNARSLASMPTRTNSNHATLITGVEPDVHGITGNAVFDRATRQVRKLGLANDLATETIFTVAHLAGRGLRTAAAVGKPKLGAMFSGDGVRQMPPDELWDARAASDSSRDDITGYAYDATTIAAARSMVEHAGADFLLVNLADVDRVSHGFGPQAPQAVEIRRRTDAVLAEFLQWLQRRPAWASTTVVITADHGFDTMTNPAIRFADVLAEVDLRGLTAVGDGGTGHVYLDPATDPKHDAGKLAAVRRIALAYPGIVEALYLRPNAADGDDRYTLDVVHPDWHLVHERTGDVLLVAKRGYQIVDGSKEEAKLIGNHGGPGERVVPAIVLGGAPTPGDGGCEHITAADLGRTVQSCLRLPEVRRLDGRPIATSDRGRILPGICGAPTTTPGAAAVTPP